jgi:hypothetical protein
MAEEKTVKKENQGSQSVKTLIGEQKQKTRNKKQKLK